MIELESILDDAEHIDELEIISDIEKKIKNAEPLLESFHQQWLMNIAMRKGLQWAQYNRITKKINYNPSSEGRVRMVINKMLGIHQTRLSKIIKDIPRLECVPASPQEEDKDLARKGTKLLDWVWQNEKMPEKIVKLEGWNVDCGTIFLMPRWDINKGPEIPVYKRHEGPINGDEPYHIDEEGYIIDDTGERIMETMSIGDVAIDIVVPFDVVNDGMASDIESSRWVIIQQSMTLDEIQMRWPEKGEEVKEEKDLKTRATYQRKLQAMVGVTNEYFSPEYKSEEKLATLKTLFEKSSKKYPKGRMVIYANGVLLESGPMPYDKDDIPLVQFKDIDISGCFWGMGSMENATPIQKGYNKSFSQLMENANAMGNTKLMAPKGHGMTKTSYDDTGNEIVEFNSGFEPHQLQPAEVPSYVINLIHLFDNAFEDVSGMHEVSNAQVPSGIKSGKAIMALQEQDDTRLAPNKMSLFRGLERLGIKILKLYELYQSEERTLQITGDSVLDIEQVKISEQEIKSLNKDVRIQSENIIASNKRVQQEVIMDIYDRGILGKKDDPKTNKILLQLLEFGNISELYEDENQSSAQARIENKLLTEFLNLKPLVDPETGMTIYSIDALYFEDHQAHLDEHNKLRRSPRYRSFSDTQRQSIDYHAKMHENFMGINNKPAPQNQMNMQQGTAQPQQAPSQQGPVSPMVGPNA